MRLNLLFGKKRILNPDQRLTQTLFSNNPSGHFLIFEKNNSLKSLVLNAHQCRSVNYFGIRKYLFVISSIMSTKIIWFKTIKYNSRHSRFRRTKWLAVNLGVIEVKWGNCLADSHTLDEQIVRQTGLAGELWVVRRFKPSNCNYCSFGLFYISVYLMWSSMQNEIIYIKLTSRDLNN